MSKLIVFADAAEIITATSTDESGVVRNASLVVEAGRVVVVTNEAAVLQHYANAERVDCTGMVLTPGFVDSHTHARFVN